MRMAVVAMVVLVLAAGDPTSLVSWLMAAAPEARAIARAITWYARRPWIVGVLAIADAPRRAVGPAMSAVTFVVDVPRRCAWYWVVRRS